MRKQLIALLGLLYCATVCASPQDNLNRIYFANNPFERDEVQNVFQEYTIQVDNVLSGNVTQGLDVLMALFSEDFTTWSSDNQASVVAPLPTLQTIEALPITNGAVGKANVRNTYIAIALNVYANYSFHHAATVQINNIGWFNNDIRRPVYNLKTHLHEIGIFQAALFELPNDVPVEILGIYNLDFVKDLDGAFRMLRFYSSTQKLIMKTDVMALGNKIAFYE
jgi:hypothetical protein